MGRGYVGVVVGGLCWLGGALGGWGVGLFGGFAVGGGGAGGRYPSFLVRTYEGSLVFEGFWNSGGAPGPPLCVSYPPGATGRGHCFDCFFFSWWREFRLCEGFFFFFSALAF